MTNQLRDITIGIVYEPSESREYPWILINCMDQAEQITDERFATSEEAYLWALTHPPLHESWFVSPIRWVWDLDEHDYRPLRRAKKQPKGYTNWYIS